MKFLLKEEWRAAVLAGGIGAAESLGWSFTPALEPFPAAQGMEGALGLLYLLAAPYQPWDAFVFPCLGMQSC